MPCFRAAFRAAVLLGCLAVGVSSPSSAQRARTIRGTAYDSLRAAPLAKAFVAIVGTDRSTTTDDAGRFTFADVGPGSYTIALQHDSLEALGFSGLTTKATVGDDDANVAIATPSFSTLWRLACGDRAESPDSGFVFGSIRDAAGGQPVPRAVVELAWFSLTVDSARGVHQRRVVAETRADDRGGYGICGVPTGANATLAAASDEEASGAVDLPPHALRVQRVNLMLGRTTPSARGSVRGRVVLETGAPIAGARVRVDSAEQRTDSSGLFIIRGLPTGTRQVEVEAIGVVPTAAVVDILPNDTVVVTIEARRVTTLSAVNVTAPRRVQALVRDIDSRRRSGLGYTIDSTSFSAANSLASALETVPSVMVENISRSALPRYAIRFASGCVAVLFIDRVRSTFDDLATFRPKDIGVIEVYPHRLMVPAELQVLGDPCGVVAVWTKYAFR